MDETTPSGTIVTFKCPYGQCEETFPTERSLRFHLRGHRSSTPLECPVNACDHLFATKSQRNHHITHFHNNSVPPDHNTSAADNGSSLSHDVNDILNTAQFDPNPDHVSATSTPENEDIQEIIDNAQYLITQIKDARKPGGVSDWEQADFRNFHQWGVWIQETVSLLDESDQKNLKQALAKKKISIGELLTAEYSVLETLLSVPGLDEQKLSWILESVAESSLDNPSTGFVKQASAKLSQNNGRGFLDKLQKVLSQFIDDNESDDDDGDRGYRVGVDHVWSQHNVEMNISPTTYTGTIISDARWITSRLSLSSLEAQAKGKILAKRFKHGRGIKRPNLELLQKTTADDIGWGCIILWTAYYFLVVDRGTPGNSDRHDGDESVCSIMRHYAGHRAMWFMPPNLMCQLCDHDIGVMDQYLSKLLSELNEEGEYSTEARDRIHILSQFKGRVGWFTTQVVRKYTERTGLLGLCAADAKVYNVGSSRLS